MTLTQLIFLIVIGLTAGWLAALIMKEKSMNVVGYLIVGVVGSFLGNYLFSLLRVPPAGLIGQLITALIGAVILIFLLRLIRK